jgi:hypothetical protein
MLEGFVANKVNFAIFDDLIDGLATIPNFKFWFGGQAAFNVGDKYMKKQRINWLKPCIYISNEDPRQEGMWKANKDWLDDNTVVVHIDRLLVEPIYES